MTGGEGDCDMVQSPVSPVSVVMSSCPAKSRNKSKCQNVRNSIKKLIELSGGQGEIDLIIGVVILTYLQQKRYFTIKGKRIFI